MMAREYLLPYVLSNTIALTLLVVAFRKPTWVRWAAILIFTWAAWTNARLALSNPAEYQGFADLAVLEIYREFILGWFRVHTAWLVVPIAVVQLGIAVLLVVNTRASRSWAVAAAVGFLLGIAPLGIGSAFPFSLTFGLALLVMARGLASRPTHLRRGRDAPASDPNARPNASRGDL